MYKQCKDLFGNIANCCIRLFDGACIPFDPDNTDYQTFKKDLAEGASLKDAEGNDMTAEQITAFLGGLQ
ncbi:MAG: hypothetical protein WCH21_10410 [Bacteroidota bacterium]